MALDAFLKKEETILLIDCHNLIFRTLFVSSEQAKKFGEDINETDFTYWKHLFLKSIMAQIKQFNPTNVVIAMDAKRSWRKDVYVDYKANRKSARDVSIIDFEKFFRIADIFFEDMKKTFSNFFFIKELGCEADDVIAVLTKRTFKDPCIIISTDRDLNQLLTLKHVKQYNPIEKKFFNVSNPKMELDLKIITGDKGDNIPAVHSKCGPVKAAKYISEGLTTITTNSALLENWNRNRVLIDFDFIPLEIETSIVEAYTKYSLAPFDGRQFFNFVVKNKLPSLMDSIQEFTATLKKINQCELSNRALQKSPDTKPESTTL